jgi:hypothetical protein
MKKLSLFLCLAVFCGIFSAGETFAQQSLSSKAEQIADWSALFPEIPGCVRIVQPITQNVKIIEQTAIYEQKDFETRKGKDPNYFDCGSISLRFEPSARRSASINYANLVNFPIYFPPQKSKVKSFDAYTESPMCGNDNWLGTTDVYFDKDMVLTVSVNLGGAGLSDFIENADYKRLKKAIGRFVKSKS